ncbi:hypothetical protein A3D70_00665 [Candidatus Adlerbacteria bacterium RIFCSPHIGHO2_02_FULL_54_18]|uniref:Tr-type G domain-containing protein n=2 Tax=Candidatus Adleribacteriota TaxID=1752736 RepID=A0A1F4Y1E6_9BACT|nr:MAG: hypothetical protein A2949_01130 [Candidatus Adlerbacteria bacterium RIFCSPLOWO2_01_FULL_54_21b]OGC87800.1 MAG: hypothetical protein A3D70_00665 [Candidatus Adlerbacteria bacterium RIFCSPHIGHO2_02_FULL_54_18]
MDTTKKNISSATSEAHRPPVVAVVGHIDHGKSTLLDYIRNTKVVEQERGGITQHLSAYEAVHTPQAGGEPRHITFLDTPGHEAFKAMRARGLEAADIAILAVSSEEGVKPQTLEALKLIAEQGLPYIVAFTKIDKPGSTIEKAKMSLLEHQIFLEGMGGDVPWIGVSSKTGEGVSELLDLILLAAELNGLSSDSSQPGQGLVIEAHIDPKRGSTATLIVRSGSVRSGEYVVVGSATAPVRIMENFAGVPIKEAPPGSPVRIVGFSELPTVGMQFVSVKNKKEAEALAGQSRVSHSESRAPAVQTEPEGEAAEEVEKVILPLIIKTDVSGSGEAVMHEIKKLPQDPRIELHVIAHTVGAVSENDVRMVGGGKTPGVILGFNVKVEREAATMAERLGVEVATFDIIYKLAEWLKAEMEKRRPRQHTEVLSGNARVLKFFSAQKGRVIVGGRVEEGSLLVGKEVRIMRRDVEIGRGVILGLQSSKKEVREVASGSEFGAMIKTSCEPASNDRLELFETTYV